MLFSTARSSLVSSKITLSLEDTMVGEKIEEQGTIVILSEVSKHVDFDALDACHGPGSESSASRIGRERLAEAVR